TRDQLRDPGCFLYLRRKGAAPFLVVEPHGTRRQADQALQIRFGDAAQIGRFDGKYALVRGLRLRGRYVVGRDQSRGEQAADVCEVLFGGVERTPRQILSVSRRISL